MRRHAVQTVALLLILVFAFMASLCRCLGTSSTNMLSKPLNEQSEPDSIKHEDIASEEKSQDRQTRTADQNLWLNIKPSEWRRFARTEGDMAELIVGLNGSEEDFESIKGLAQSGGGMILRSIKAEGYINAVAVCIPFEKIKNFVYELKIHSLCAYVEPNRKFEPDRIPNDPFWNAQWSPPKIEADFAWNTTVGNHSVLIAVIDTGIDYKHPDLMPNYVPLGYDWVNDDDDPMDDNGHGTFCAGIATAAINNGIGIAGIAQVSVMCEKVIDRNGECYEDLIARGIIHAVDQGADILSCSWGDEEQTFLVESAIKYAYSHGVLICTSAGNTATQMKHYPAAYSECVAVTATDRYDRWASFSTYGDWVEVAAPGVNILSTYSGRYEYGSGTSVSCPHVAGVAALILSRFPDLSVTQLRQTVRYATDDLGEPGFDKQYGYGRINARKGIEEQRLNHDLVLWNLIWPSYVEPCKSGLINATIYNFGRCDEDNITVRLFANDSFVGLSSISHLATDSFATIALPWVPISEGKYNLTVYVMPVLGETEVRYNCGSRIVDVGFPLKIFVIDSAGSDMPYVTQQTWERLNEEWRNLGDTVIHVDYTSLRTQNITYENLESTGADVLFISCADGAHREYSDREIEAITRYVYEGHGLICTAAFYSGSNPNNNKLAPLFGLDKYVKWKVADSGSLNVLEPNHPIFARVPVTYDLSRYQVTTCCPEDSYWDSNELWGGRYIALGENHHSAIVEYRGLLYISPFLEIAGYWPPLLDMYPLQILYNAMTWSRFQKPEHELTVSIKTPGLVVTRESSMINATVTNIGLRNETNVTIEIIVNGSLIFSYVTPNLVSGSSYTISSPWKPVSEGVYNVTAFVLPASGEDNVWNNEESAWIHVQIPSNVLIVADNEEESQHGLTSLREFESALGNLGFDYYVWDEKTLGSPPQSFINQFKLTIWTCGTSGTWQVSTSDAQTLISYIKQGGKVLIDGDIVVTSHVTDIDFMKYVTHAQYIGEAHWLCEGLNVAKRNHLIAWGLPEEFKWDSLPSIIVGVQPIYDGVIVLNYIDNLFPPNFPRPWPSSVPASWGAIVASEAQGQGGSTLFLSFPFSAMPEIERLQVMRNALTWMFVNEHEVYVSANIPKNGFLEAKVSAWINSTVTNWGLNDETNMKLQILINNSLVDLATIPQINNFSSAMHSFLWRPETAGSYNITINVFPASGENTLYDNVVNISVKVRHLVVALISDKEELESTTSIFDYMGIGYHIYDANWYYDYSTNLALLSSYRVIIMDKSSRKSTPMENATLQSYLVSGGSLLITGTSCLLHENYVDAYMCDVVRAKCSGLYLFHQSPILYVVNGTHPIMDGPYGKFEAGYFTSLSSFYFENATADLSRNAVTVAKGFSPDFLIDKIIATDVGSGRVAYWNGEGVLDWTQRTDCQAIFKNIICWLEFGIYHDLSTSAELPPLIKPTEPVTVKVNICNLGYYDEHNVKLELFIDDVEVFSTTVEMPKRSSYIAEYRWMPLHEGKFNFTAYVQLVTGEIDSLNNIYSTSIDVRFWPQILLDTPAGNKVGETLTVSVRIMNATDLHGWKLELYYRNYVLNACSVEEGPLLKSVGSTSFEVMYFNDAYNSTCGCIRLSCMFTELTQYSSGCGIAATITLTAKATGLCGFTLSNTTLVTFAYPSSCPHSCQNNAVIIGLLGDLNNDGVTNILDVVIVTTSYGLKLGQPHWNPQADVVPDNVVNILDIVKITANYGKVA